MQKNTTNLHKDYPQTAPKTKTQTTSCHLSQYSLHQNKTTEELKGRGKTTAPTL